MQPTPRGSAHLTVSKTTEFHGPLPPPSVLAEYDRVKSGLAERIVAMAEQQAQHRKEMEREVLAAQIVDAKADRSERRFGQVFAFCIALVCFIAGTYTATHGAPWPGALLGGTGVTGIVLAFLNQRRTEKLQSKEEGDEEA